VKVLVEGKSRARVQRFVADGAVLRLRVRAHRGALRGPEVEALVRTVHATFENYVKLNKKVPPETLNTVVAGDQRRRGGSRTPSSRT
jgi:ATP-dependent Lon protease